MSLLNSLHPLGVVRWLHEPQSTMTGVRRTLRRGFHTLRGSIDQGDLRIRPRVVGVVELWKYFYSGDQTLYTPGVAGPRRCPQRQLSPRAGSMSISQLATSQLGWGFHTLQGGIDPRNLRLLPRVMGVVEIRKGFEPAM